MIGKVLYFFLAKGRDGEEICCQAASNLPTGGFGSEIIGRWINQRRTKGKAGVCASCVGEKLLLFRIYSLQTQFDESLFSGVLGAGRSDITVNGLLSFDGFPHHGWFSSPLASC